jgi:ERCC4-related helicase
MKKLYSEYQSCYFSYWLTRHGLVEEAMSQTLASAKVDMNPHQIEGALFALQSPFSDGVLLADEVGLGKTIEGCLVIAQRWAEKKQKILLIVPASLRKQWEQELWDKFHLPSFIIDGEVLKKEKKNGIDNPFDQKEKIIISSYEFAAKNDKYLKQIAWDIVVFDEAHKLSNIYKESGSKNAKKLNNALSSSFKLLLSATPLQNDIRELYGLISIIDANFFGDVNSFNKLSFDSLRERLKSIVYRTLREDVQKIGDIKFTQRYSITQDFSLMQEEKELYDKISSYLRSSDTSGIHSQSRQLLSFTIRKILASSSFAIKGTLDNIIQHLETEKEKHLASTLEDFDIVNEYIDEKNVDLDEPQLIKALKEEINTLKSYRDLAENIQKNSKGEALLLTLPKALKMNQQMGGNDKVVIFTESVRTQQYLKELLESQDYKNQLVLLNGNNNDKESRNIYKDWKDKYQDSNQISGVKTADMKAAIVDHFKHKAKILISTESGGEGINLQFCSILINYDLPWNPQRVEQRIGRVHRYGQKNDVVVVNFINRENRADCRVFELLEKKFKLFDGVFGASDEILGTIANNIDIEKRIYDIYQNHCRDNKEIDEHFNKLEEDFKPELEKREKNTGKKLLDHFAKDVVQHLKGRRSDIDRGLNEYQSMLKRLVQAELVDVKFDQDCFEWENQEFCLDWKNAEKRQSNIFSVKESLGKKIVDKAKKIQLRDNVFLQFHHDEYQERPKAVYLEKFIGFKGYLQLNFLEIKTKKRCVEYLLVNVYSDNNESLPENFGEELLLIPAKLGDKNTYFSPDVTKLEQLKEEKTKKYLAEVEEDHEKWFEKEEIKLDNWREDQISDLQTSLNDLNNEIRLRKKELRKLSNSKEKIELRKEIRKLEKQRDTKSMEINEKTKEIDNKADQLLDEAVESLELTHNIKTIFTICWELLA